MNARPNFIPGLGHVAKDLGTDATIRSFCPNSAAADDEAERLGMLDQRDGFREQAVQVVRRELIAQLMGRLETGSLRQPVTDATATVKHKGWEAKEIQVEAFDAMLNVIEQPQVFAHFMALVMSPAAAVFRQSVAHAHADLNASDVAEARGWVV